MEYLYETHMHTAEISACAKSSAAEMVRAYKKWGYAGIIVTDHFINGYSTCPDDAPWDVRMRYFMTGYENAKAAGERLGLDVFLGWEYTIKGSDFLTYGLGLDFLLAYPNVDKLTIEAYSALVRDCGGYIAQAHPYRDAWYIERKLPVNPNLLDGVEAYNAMDASASNKKALAFAEKHGLPVQAGSDAHSTDHSCLSGVIMNHRAESVFDIIAAVKGNRVALAT